MWKVLVHLLFITYLLWVVCEVTDISEVGCITVAVGIFVLFLLPPVPEKLKWGFSSAEKDMAVRRSREAFNAENAGIVPAQLLSLARDVKMYLYSELPFPSSRQLN